jgi:hypothetical protein
VEPMLSVVEPMLSVEEPVLSVDKSCCVEPVLSVLSAVMYTRTGPVWSSQHSFSSLRGISQENVGPGSHTMVS